MNMSMKYGHQCPTHSFNGPVHCVFMDPPFIEIENHEYRNSDANFKPSRGINSTQAEVNDRYAREHKSIVGVPIRSTMKQYYFCTLL